MTRKFPIVILSILLLAACAVPAPAATPAPASPRPTQGADSPMYPTPPVLPGLQPLIDQARKDLARRLSISDAGISLLRAEVVNWSDSSLGCPQPDMAYAQVITPGYLVVLQAGGKQYEYHAGRSGPAVYCPNPMPPSPAGSPDV